MQCEQFMPKLHTLETHYLLYDHNLQELTAIWLFNVKNVYFYTWEPPISHLNDIDTISNRKNLGNF